MCVRETVKWSMRPIRDEIVRTLPAMHTKPPKMNLFHCGLFYFDSLFSLSPPVRPISLARAPKSAARIIKSPKIVIYNRSSTEKPNIPLRDNWLVLIILLHEQFSHTNNPSAFPQPRRPSGDSSHWRFSLSNSNFYIFHMYTRAHIFCFLRSRASFVFSSWKRSRRFSLTGGESCACSGDSFSGTRMTRFEPNVGCELVAAD